MTVRQKLIIAWLLSAVAFVIAMNVLRTLRANGIFFLVAALIVFPAIYFFASSLRCPRCRARGFPASRLATPFVPKRCWNCGHDLSDRMQHSDSEGSP